MPLEPAAAAAGPVLSVGWVESGGGSVVLVLLVVVLLLVVVVVALVGGSLVVVGGLVVVGTVVVVGLRRGLVVVGAGGVVEVAARRLRGTDTGCWRVVVVELVELADESCWRCGKVAVVVVCAVALATWPGVVTKPTMLPPIAPISIAVTTLTQRRAATNEIGRNTERPPVRAS